ncbi:pyridoxamine 5'-phosphate oxidase family protein [Hasllibacter halocynthiae]|uniref:pyridoxamine 5'-phosphate oxidase family protein n=1 Tax=Hasllibacter halocynthiae TaxID=595589 RepID=UPI001FE7CF51|nr:pyridoxamine 5'-phosphate oxidase family protein [Hasllibacter halocynthiae]
MSADRPDGDRFPWAAELDGLHAKVWERLARGVHDARAAARHPVLATISAAGPEARTVGLRRADRAAGEVEVHTDLGSDKVAELRADPRAALHVWDRKVQLQVRLRMKVEVLSGREVEERWRGIPQEGRLNYGGEPPPGTPIGHWRDHEATVARERFGVLLGRVEEIDAVVLGERPHRRALFRRADGWAGRWLAP